MNKLFTYALVYLLLCSFSRLTAQNTSEPLASKNPISTTSNSMSKASSATDDLEEARRRFKMLFNFYRDFSVTIDTIMFKEKDVSSSKTEAVPLSFSAYLSKMTVILSQKVDKINPNTDKSRTELSHFLAGLNTLKSAKCFQSDNQANAFINTHDMSNNAITAFDLGSLRKNSRYGLIENYREGFARIRKDQVFGYLNLCGEEVIPCQYERAEPFNAGFALAKRVDWFFIDGDGNETEALENVADAKALKNGVSWLKMNNGKQTLIDNNFVTSKVSLSKFYDAIDTFYANDVFRIRVGKKIGLIGLNGKVIFDAVYDNIEPTNIAGIYRIYQNKNIGLIDSTWAIRLSPTYETVADFNAFGLALVKNQTGFAYIEAKTFKMTKYYTYLSDFNDFGVSIIRNEGNLYGLIDSTLTVTVPPKYVAMGVFNELGLASACQSEGKCGFIKYDGKEQIKANYESVTDFNAFGLAVATTIVENCDPSTGNCKAEIVIDRNGNTVIPVSDESLKKKWHYELADSLYAKERYIIVNVIEDGRLMYSLVHKENFQLITPLPYQSIAPMDIYGNLRVKKDGKWGIIDSLGKVLAKPMYQDMKRGHENFYPTQNDKGKWGYLNKKGKAQIPFEYDEVRNFYRSGFACVSKGRGKLGLITPFNAKIVPCIFRSIDLNKDETKFVVTDDNDNVFIINFKGECETNCPKFDELRAKANKESALEKK